MSTELQKRLEQIAKESHKAPKLKKEKTAEEKEASAARGRKFVVTFLIFFINPIFIMLCWNFLTQELPITIGENILTLPKLAYSHALALYFMCGLLFKSKAKSETESRQVDPNISKIEKTLEVLKQTKFN